MCNRKCRRVENYKTAVNTQITSCCGQQNNRVFQTLGSTIMSRYRINYKGCEVLLRCANSYELKVRDDRSIQGALFWHMLARAEENHKAYNRNGGYGSLVNMKIVQCPLFSAECVKIDI